MGLRMEFIRKLEEVNRSIQWMRILTYQNRNTMLFSELNCQWMKTMLSPKWSETNLHTRLVANFMWIGKVTENTAYTFVSIALAHSAQLMRLSAHFSAMRWLTFCSLHLCEWPFGHSVRCMRSILTSLRTYTFVRFAHRQTHYFHNTILFYFFFDWCNILFSTGVEFYLFFT